MRADQAETLALGALEWIVAQDDLLGVFLGSGGVAQTDLAARAGDPDVLAAVLDFLLMDDAWVIGFCDSRGCAYTDVAQARAALPGGMQVNWT